MARTKLPISQRLHPHFIGTKLDEHDAALDGHDTAIAALNSGAVAGGGPFVFRPGSMIPRDKVYTTWATALAAIPRDQGFQLLQVDNAMEISGGALAFSGGTITYTAPVGAPAFAAAVAGQVVQITGATNSGNNGHFYVATRSSGTVITITNASGVTEAGFAGTLTIFGGFTCIVPSAGMPTDGWDMTNLIVAGYQAPVGLTVNNQLFQFGGAPSGGDVQFRNWLKTGGDLAVTNLNVTLPAIVVPLGGMSVEWGTGFAGDPPILACNGTAPMWDNSTAGSTLTIRLAGRIAGTTPAINAGNANYSPNPTVAFQSLGVARVAANMITGTNAAAILGFGALNVGCSWGRQQNWAGNITEPNTLWLRTQVFPASLLQASPVPATAALTFTTGMAWNASCAYDTTAADITQQLPMVRAAAPATGAVPGQVGGGVAGVLDSTGLFAIVDNAVGTHNVIVQPNSTTPDTFEDGSASVIVPPGACFLFQSDGISKVKLLSSRGGATAPATLSGPGTLDITRTTTLYTSTGAGDAIVLPNGTYKGQRHRVMHTVDGGSGVITATTPGNHTNVTLTNHWEWADFEWSGTAWNVIGASPVAVVA